LFSGDFDDERFLLAFSSAGRHLGNGSIALSTDEAARLAANGVRWSVEGWGSDELGRVLLVGAAFTGLAPLRAASLFEACYARGDNRERQAVLRALPFLPDASRFVSLGVDACRSSVETV